MVDTMRETVWALNPRHDTIESFARFLASQVESLAGGAGLRCRLEIPDRLPSLSIPSSVRHHLYLTVKEALNNAVKHAGATEVRLTLEVAREELRLSVADDGCGFDAEQPRDAFSLPQGGNGLSNMRQRISDLQGQIEIGPGPAGGAQVTIRVPTKSLRAKQL
jgi:signal transduction histidine kinase